MKKRSLNSRRDAFRMNTTNCVSEIAYPCGRVVSASQPTTVSTSSTLSTMLPFGVAQAIGDRLAVGVELRIRDHLGRIALVLPVDLAQLLHQVLLLLPSGFRQRGRRNRRSWSTAAARTAGGIR